MATYNCIETLDEAVQSILDQTYPEWDLIVCDDASTDGTYELMEVWRDRFPERFRLIRNGRNSKLAFSLNRCLALVDGELVARMDGDDVAAPERFARQVEFLRNNGEVDLVGTAMRRFDHHGLADVVTAEPTPTRSSLRSGVPFCHATVMAHRHVFESLKGYTVKASTERAEDVDLWFRFFLHGFVGSNLADCLYYVREDVDAIMRRGFKTRLNVFRTTMAGYALLEYPLLWYPIPIGQLLKSVVPSRFILLYRRWQKGERRNL